MHKQQGWPQAWEYCQAKLIQTFGRASQGVDWSWSHCIKSHHAQTSSGKGLPSHLWKRNNDRSILPGLKRKRPGLFLRGPKSSFQIKVHFAFHLEIKVWKKTGEAQNPSCLKSNVKFPKSEMIWGAVTSAGVDPLFFFKSNVNVAIYEEILEHFMLPSADKLYGDADFLFQQDSAKPLSSGLLTRILLCLISQPTCLTWVPYVIYGIFSRERWETVNPTIQTSWRLNGASAVPQADRFHATPHWCWSLCQRSPDQVLSA